LSALVVCTWRKRDHRFTFEQEKRMKAGIYFNTNMIT
jgi:hypothetical protein